MRRGAGRQLGQGGFSLLEILVAMVLLAMVAAMLYSVLKVGIAFTEQGSRKILAMERRYGLVSLVQRQVLSAVFDPEKRKMLIWSDEAAFKLVTRSPYIYPEAGLVLAIYRYHAGERAVYYTEKRDYWNIDYNETYVPEYSDMTVLAQDEDGFVVQYDEEASPEVVFSHQGVGYSLVPKSADQESLRKMEFER